MNAFCSICGEITHHDELSEDKFQVYLKCTRCGTKRTWSKAG